MQNFDHYSTIEGVRRTPSPTPVPRLPRAPLRLPRRNMQDFVYPPDFDLEENLRVRGLNATLLGLYRKIGARADDLAREQELHGALSYYDSGVNCYGVRFAEIKLEECVDQAEALLAEVAAIGGKFHIPPQLLDIVKVKNYVLAGSFERLAGPDFFLQEKVDDDVVPNEHQRTVLQDLIFKGNRLSFLQECGDRFTNTVRSKDLTRSLKEGLQQLALSQLPADIMPAILNRLAQLVDCRLEDFFGDGHGDPPAADGLGDGPTAEGDDVGSREGDGSSAEGTADDLGDGPTVEGAADDLGDGPTVEGAADDLGDGPTAEGAADNLGDGPTAEGDDVGSRKGDDVGQEDDDVGWEGDLDGEGDGLEDDDLGWEEEDVGRGDVGWWEEDDLGGGVPAQNQGDGLEDDDLGWEEEDVGGGDVGWWEEDDLGGGVPVQNQHLIFISSGEDEKELVNGIMQHIIFLSSSDDEVAQHQAQGEEADDHPVLLLVVPDEERGPQHTIFLSSTDEG